MDHYFQSYHGQDSTLQTQLVNNTCHIKLDSESNDVIDMEVVWCSFCQRCRFGDGSEDLCLCTSTSFANVIDPWLQKPLECSTLSDQTGQYNAIDSWLQLLIDDKSNTNILSSPFDATARQYSEFSDPSTLQTQSTKTMSSRGSSVNAPSERRSSEPDRPESREFRNMIISQEKRRERNRTSQRKFRQRKDQLVKDLQARVEELTKINEILSKKVSELQDKGNDSVQSVR